MGSEKYVLGIDGGTGGIRAGLFAVATGEPIAFADTPYDTSYPKPGHAEQSPSDWWNGLGASSRKVLRESGIDPRDVAGVCVDTTCCTVVALDADANSAGGHPSRVISVRAQRGKALQVCHILC